MERRQRLTFAAIAVVIAAVAVIVLAGGGDDSTETAATTNPAATSTATAESTAEATGTPTAEPTPEVTEIRVRDGEVQGGEAEIEVDQGDTVRFRVTADVADHVHVHGYDKLADVAPGKPARFTFKATIPGIFEVELEDAGLPVARLRVNQ
jgi:plastocyanin